MISIQALFYSDSREWNRKQLLLNGISRFHKVICKDSHFGEAGEKSELPVE
jgi:hypothetical protein